ncbi:MAG: adenylyl-sulfate kinase [Gammaproteobacteria bacterium]|nr:adenylyl-sulfate kinase [Gammaproteobacteria bacterium]
MVMPKATNIKPYAGLVSIEDRCKLLNQKGATIWFTGISGSGKSTIATTLEKALLEQEIFSYLLDSDNVRTGINQDLGFSEKDRKENIRRIGEIAKLFVEVGFIVLSSFISPYKVDRDNLRRLHEDANLRFFEVFVDCSLVEAERRDPKGLYRKARKGEIKGFTGIDHPYEAPVSADLILRTDQLTLEEEIAMVLSYLKSKEVIGSQYLNPSNSLNTQADKIRS